MRALTKVLSAFVLLGFSLIHLGGETPRAHAAVFADLETGLAFSNSNNVRVPGDTGSRFSLTDDLSSQASAFGRLRLGWEPGRHHLSLLIAPVRLNSEGSINREIRFQDEVFTAGTPLTARYRFDTYRLSYRYWVWNNPRLQVGLGATGLLRSAAIRLRSDTQEAEKTNIGFVPLLRGTVNWVFSPFLGLAFDLEGLATGQGRAFDGMLALTLPIWNRVVPRVGYRFIEGGSNTDEVYNFALIHFLFVGVTVSMW